MLPGECEEDQDLPTFRLVSGDSTVLATRAEELDPVSRKRL